MQSNFHPITYENMLQPNTRLKTADNMVLLTSRFIEAEQRIQSNICVTKAESIMQKVKIFWYDEKEKY